MQVGQNTTFSQVHQEFASGKATPGRLAGKHLRFDGANKLYTHSASPFVKSNKGEQAAIERAMKQEKGALMVLQSIDNQYGPGYGDKIFKNIAAQHHVDLDQGVTRRDLNLIQRTIAQDQAARQQVLREVRDSTPAGLNLTTGEDPVHVAGPFSVAGMQQAQHTLDSGTIVTTNNRTELGLPSVSEQFCQDHVDRVNELILDDGQNTVRPIKNGHPDPRTGLRTFTGTDASAKNLSHYLHQGMLAPLVNGGMVTLENGSAQPIAAGAAGNFKPSYTVTKSGSDYIINYKSEGALQRLMGGNKDLKADPSGSRLTYSMQIKVSQADLEAGNGNYQITQPPSYDILFKPDWDGMING